MHVWKMEIYSTILKLDLCIGSTCVGNEVGSNHIEFLSSCLDCHHDKRFGR
jgi:hypothetical protein